MVEFQASFSALSKPILRRLLLCIFPSHSSFHHPRHSHHTGLSDHMGVPCLRPIISNYHTMSFSLMGISCFHPSIPATHPDFLPIPVVVLLYAHVPTNPPPPFSFPANLIGLHEVVFLSPLGATMTFFFAPLLQNLSPLHIPQIRDIAPPSAPRLSIVALCRS